MKILTVISARGGSKRIPKKNIKSFCGKQLIVWTIEAALKAKTTSRVIVTTDDKEIALIAKNNGAEVPFLRSKELAKDSTPGIDPVLDAISKINGYDWVLLLQPTSPLRNQRDIDNMIDFSLERNSLSTVSVNKLSSKLSNIYFSNRSSQLSKVIDFIPKSQSIETTDGYVLNGSMYLSNIPFLIKKFLIT